MDQLASPKSPNTEKTRVICLHASGSTGQQWQVLKENLQKDFDVQHPNLVGYGKEVVEKEAWTHRMEDEVQPFLDLIDTQNQSVHLVGHSMGGAIALKVAMRRPERVLSVSLYEPVPMHLLLAFSGVGVELQQSLNLYTTISTNIADNNVREAAKGFIDFWSGEGSWDSIPEKRQSRMLPRVTKLQREYEALISDRTPPIDYWQLTMPILYMVGTQSPKLPSTLARNLIKYLPDVKTQTIDGADHMGPITAAAKVNQSIEDFIRLHALTATSKAA